VRSEDLWSVAHSATLTRGLGRSYGDSSLPPPGESTVAGSVLADRILAFDANTGVLRAEAGFTLQEMNRIFLPRGWFTPVSPGTKFVTLGGMVASDVHGKNHHRKGTFGAHVRSLRMCLADGRSVECSPSHHADLFHATLGGMGLTGHILEVECVLERVPSPWIVMESRRVTDIDHLLHELDGFGRHWPFTMAWVDCVSRGSSMGRGVVMAGRWAEPDEAPIHPPAERRKLTVPFMFPSWALNRWSVRLFNELYYRSHPRRQQAHLVHPDKFFYPLDAIHGWNRVYGRRGFTQYQCVLPDVGPAAGEGDVPSGRAAPAGAFGIEVAGGAAPMAGDASARPVGPEIAAPHALASVPARPRATRQAVRAFMDLLTRSGAASPLCVVKDCGDEGAGMLSFPKRGVSIAADFAVTPRTQALVDALNELVIAHGGRIYLTKDAFTRPEHYRAMEPRLEAWQAVRRRWDPEGRLRSRQSVRLLGDPE
jgi:FAD/FMN-containing dehydrogenase